jgi:hypothetical protein
MRKITAFLMLLTLALISCKQLEKEKIYTTYKCPDGKIPSCEDCIKQSTQMTFLLNKEEKSVMGKSYIDGKNTFTFTRKNCVIFDERNWDCSNEQKTSPFKLITKDFMSDGIHRFYIQTFNEKMHL